MAVGDNTDTSVIWFPGESSGRTGLGVAGASIPDELRTRVSGFIQDDFDYATEEYAAGLVTALTERLVASGLLPD